MLKCEAGCGAVSKEAAKRWEYTGRYHNQKNKGSSHRCNRKEKERGVNLALTRDFKETVQARVKRDAAFRKGLLSEAIERLLSGEVSVGKELLRDYINAIVGFPKLAAHTKIHVKTLHQMFGRRTAIRLPGICLISLPIAERGRCALRGSIHTRCLTNLTDGHPRGRQNATVSAPLSH